MYAPGHNTFWLEDNELAYRGPFRVLSSRVRPENGDTYGDDGYVTITRVQAPRGMDSKTVERTLNQGMRMSCNCAHDCCGHTFTAWNDVKHDKRREYIITGHQRYNI